MNFNKKKQPNIIDFESESFSRSTAKLSQESIFRLFFFWFDVVSILTFSFNIHQQRSFVPLMPFFFGDKQSDFSSRLKILISIHKFEGGGAYDTYSTYIHIYTSHCNSSYSSHSWLIYLLYIPIHPRSISTPPHTYPLQLRPHPRILPSTS